MNEILIAIDSILRFTLFCLFFVMLCLSIKKCFLKNNKIRPVHIIMILFTNPYVMLTLSAVLLIIVCMISLSLKGYDLKYLESYMNNISYSIRVIFTLIMGLFFTLLVLLSSYLVGKKLKASNKSLVTYIYFMFAILMVLSDSKSTFKSDAV